MTTPTVSITQDDVLTALREFILTCVDPATVEVVQGQDNRVPEPDSDDFIVMTPVDRVRLSTNIDTYDSLAPTPALKTALQKTRLNIQLDVHGPHATDNVQIITTLFRDDYGCQSFANSGFDIQPLWIDDGHQMPFVNGENQYETRWVLSAWIQANPVVVTPQQFADSITVDLIEVDATFPP